MAGLILLEMIADNEQEERRGISHLMKTLRDHNNPFEMPDLQFRLHFRLCKEAALYVLNFLTPYIEPGVRVTRIDSMRMVLCTLNFLGTGSYQRSVGFNILTLLSQPMVSRSVTKIVNLINMHMARQWIKFPHNNHEYNELKMGFLQLGLPDIVGAIDGTHVAIVKPLLRENVYVNRKHYHSINVQIICDSKLKILNINSKYPGSCHDAYVWRNSNIQAMMRANYLNNRRHTYLIGDSGYPLQPWLLTPFHNPPQNSAEERYNGVFVRVRSVVERCIGVMKGRFRCMLKQRTLHYSPVSASKKIIACAVLHNITLFYNQNVDEVEFDEIDQQAINIRVDGNFEFRREAQIIRQEYIQRYFN